MGIGFPGLLRAAINAVDLCRVQPHEKVVILTDSEKNPALVEAFYSAALTNGNDPVYVRTLSRFPETSPPSAAVAAMKDADVVFDLASNTWLYSLALPEIMATGTRILQILLPERAFVERAPGPEIAWRATLAEALVADGQQIEITSRLGTELQATRGQRPWLIDRGYVWKEGQWGSYGVNMVNCAPLEQSVNGIVYFNGPMILFPQYCWVTSEPIKAEVKNGRIVAIDTSHGEARKFERWLQQFGDPNVYLIAHVGFGLDPRATLDVFDLAGWESYFGGVAVAFGANASPSLRGGHQAAGHMDGILLNAGFRLDGKEILVDGVFDEATGLR
jgi:2,5-dihydroxypyridine 5,6-dioxygenase